MIRGPNGDAPKPRFEISPTEEPELKSELEPEEMAEEVETPELRTQRLLAVTDRQITENAERLRVQNDVLRQHFQNRQDAEKERTQRQQAGEKSLFGVTKTQHRSGATGETVEVTKQVDLDRRTTMAASVKVVGPKKEDLPESS